MTFVLSLIAQVLHIALMIAVAPVIAGGMDWLDARLSGRAGAPVLLPWRDLVRLFRKTPAVTEGASAVARFAPAVSLGMTVSVASLVPSFTLGMALSPLADVLVIASLLAAARVAVALAAFESGAALPGLMQQGASVRAVFAEPALMLAVVALALMAGSFNLDAVIGQQQQGALLPAAASAIVLAAMLALLLAHGSVADRGAAAVYGGRELAMLRVADWLRRLVWIDLIGALFLPVGMGSPDSGPLGWCIGLVVWVCRTVGFAVCLSVVRTIPGPVPRQSLPDLLGVAALLALLAMIIVLASAGTA